MKWKTIILTLVLAFVFSQVLPTYSTEAQYKNITLKINGQDQKMNALLDNGTVFVPMRSIFKVFNQEINYYSDSQIIATSSLSFHYMIGDKYVFVNDKQVYLDRLPIKKDGFIYIPLRLVADIFNVNVIWDGNNCVLIRTANNNEKRSITSIRADLIKSGYPIPHFYYIGPTGGPKYSPPYIHLDLNAVSKIVTITNISGRDVDLSNWKVSYSQDKESFVFNKGFKLLAGQNVRLTLDRRTGDYVWNALSKTRLNGPNRVYISGNDGILNVEG